MFQAHKTLKEGLARITEMLNDQIIDKEVVEYENLLKDMSQAIDDSILQDKSLEEQLKESQFSQYEKAEINLLLKIILDQSLSLRVAQRNYMHERGNKSGSRDRREKAGQSVATEARKLDAAIDFVKSKMSK